MAERRHPCAAYLLEFFHQVPDPPIQPGTTFVQQFNVRYHGGSEMVLDVQPTADPEGATGEIVPPAGEVKVGPATPSTLFQQAQAVEATESFEVGPATVPEFTVGLGVTIRGWQKRGPVGSIFTPADVAAPPEALNMALTCPTATS